MWSDPERTQSYSYEYLIVVCVIVPKKEDLVLETEVPLFILFVVLFVC